MGMTGFYVGWLVRRILNSSGLLYFRSFCRGFCLDGAGNVAGRSLLFVQLSGHGDEKYAHVLPGVDLSFPVLFVDVELLAALEGLADGNNQAAAHL